MRVIDRSFRSDTAVGPKKERENVSPRELRYDGRDRKSHHRAFGPELPRYCSSSAGADVFSYESPASSGSSRFVRLPRISMLGPAKLMQSIPSSSYGV